MRISKSRSRSYSSLTVTSAADIDIGSKNVVASSADNGVSKITVFSNYCLARIFSIRYIGISSLIRYNVVRTLTYEKHTTVLYQPVSQCSRLSHRRPADF